MATIFIPSWASSGDYGQSDDVAGQGKRKLNFSNFRYGISEVDNARGLMKTSALPVKPLFRRSGSATSPIQRERDPRGVVMLRLNRPQAFNALSEGLITQLQRQLESVAEDPLARVVVLAAAGKAFCAGHDLKEMRAAPSLDYYRRLFARCSEMMLCMQRLPVPVIARVQEIATAAGCQLVAMCDLAVASSDAKFAVSGVNLGLFCSAPGVALSRNLSRKAAFEMLVTGEFISACEAKTRGLVNRVVEPAELDAEV